MATNVLRTGVVTRVGTDGAWCEIPELAPHQEFGPMETGAVALTVGDRVLVGQVSGSMEDFVVIGLLVMQHTDPPIPPFPPANSSYILYYENQTLRDAAGLTLVSGLATWLDDEQRLDIYTDEGTPHWQKHYGFNASGSMLLPQGVQIGIGSTPTASLDSTLTASTGLFLRTNVTGDTNRRFSAQADGKLQWGAGNTTADVSLSRFSSGRLRLDTHLGINADPGSSSHVYIERDGASMRGLKLKNTSVVSGAQPSIEVENSAAGLITSKLLTSIVDGDSNDRFNFLHDGTFNWGSGSATPDTNLYRAAANKLKTDDDFEVGGKFSRPGIFINWGTPNITSSSVTVLTPSSCPYNNYGIWTSGTNFTLPRSGEWEIGAVLRFASQATTVGIRQLRITRNGNDEMLFACPTTTQQNSTNTVAQGVHHFDGVAGDVITIGTFQNSGATLALVTGSNAWIRLVEG